MEKENCFPKPDNTTNAVVSGFFAGVTSTLIVLKWIFKFKF